MEAKRMAYKLKWRKLKEEDPERYAEIRRKNQQRFRDACQVKFDEPQPCPYCAKMFEFKYAMQVSVCKAEQRFIAC